MPESHTKNAQSAKSVPADREGDFVNDIQAALLLQSPRGGRLILYTITLLVAAALVWSWHAEIDDVVIGQGRIVPSSHLQDIQNLEGGVLKEIRVQEGQIVDKGDVLLVLDDVQFSSGLEKNLQEAVGYEAAMERLRAESRGEELDFPEKLVTQYPKIVEAQTILFNSRRENLKNQVDALQFAKREKEQQLEQAREKLESAREKLELSQLELNKLTPMLATGAVSEMEILQARRKVADAKAEMNDARLAIPGIQSSIQEARERIDQAVTEFREKAENELNEIIPKYRGLVAMQKSLMDKVARTGIRSPVHGTVKKIYVDTIGQTVRPGITMMEIVPLDDRLLVETKVPPKDIGFIREGLKAKVKLSAYDFAVYGGLEGTVEGISADSITDDKGRTFFLINVSIPQNYIGGKEEGHIIIPGMQAEVDIVITRRKLIDYILRPLLKAKYT